MSQTNRFRIIIDKVEKFCYDVVTNPRKYGLLLLALFILGSAMNGLLLDDYRIAIGLIVAALLPISWYVIQIDQNVVDLKKGILEELSTQKECNDILTTYLQISEPGFCAYKIKLREHFLKELQNLAGKKRTGHLSVEEGHIWSIPIIESLQDGDYIRAVSFLSNDKGEWEEKSSPYWKDYNEAIKTAAEKCKDVIRIFITDDEKFHKHFNDKNSIVHKHSLDKSEMDKVRCMCVDKNKLDLNYRNIRHLFDNSFILISSNNKKVAVFDMFLDRSEVEKRYYVEISYGAEVQEIDNALTLIIKPYEKDKSQILSDYVYNEYKSAS